ncbi:hypothetical protein [Moorena bouillonii]|uniref:hypothetical protein n=1 Tax=Moorena bouillonii TaxID=207920 RepID=UPI002E8E6114|nr:hypothetical protein [Moorena bouillonii]
MVSGQWSVVSGQWAVVSGQWSVVSGQWSAVSGQLILLKSTICRVITASKPVNNPAGFDAVITHKLIADNN